MIMLLDSKKSTFSCVCQKKAVILQRKIVLSMKKYLFISLFALVAIMFTGCEKKQQEPEPCRFHKLTLDLVVDQRDWQFDNDTKQFYYHFDIDELTADVYNYAELSISREFNAGTKDAYQVALPMSTYLEEEVDNGDNTVSTVYYTQHIDYRFGIKYVEIQVTNSDHIYAAENPESMIFRMQLTY